MWLYGQFAQKITNGLWCSCLFVLAVELKVPGMQENFSSLSLQRKYSRQSGVKETLIIYAFDVSIDYQHRRQGVKPLV